MLQYAPQAPVSSTFNAVALFGASSYAPPNAFLRSSNGMLFCVHQELLMQASANCFGGYLRQQSSQAAPICLPDDSEVLDVVLHNIYGLDLSEGRLPWAALVRVMEAMASYETYPPQPGTALFNALLAHVHRPGGAQDVYAIAACYDCYALAVAASEYLLAVPLTELSEDWTLAVGAVYMKRLYFLHLGRVEAFNRIVTRPLVLHASSDLACRTADRQENVLGPWAMAVSQFIFNARPDIPSSAIEAALNPIAYKTPCPRCGNIVRSHIQAISDDWSAVKKTIHWQ